jgi:hypothetical protein
MRVVRNALDALAAPRNPEVLAMVLSVGGMVAVISAAIWLVAVPELHADVRHAEATVTRFERVDVEQEPRKARVFKDVPVVRFQDGKKQVEVRIANLLDPLEALNVGQKVNVVYRAGNPQEARIPNPVEFYLLPATVAAGGAFFWWLGAALFKTIGRHREG